MSVFLPAADVRFVDGLRHQLAAEKSALLPGDMDSPAILVNNFAQNRSEPELKQVTKTQ